MKAPYLVAGREVDELCPLKNSVSFAKALGGPKQLVIYADARHSIGAVPAANGSDPRAYEAKWIAGPPRLQAVADEYGFVEPSGRVVKTPLA